MGLDSVELLLALEEEFQIIFTDEEALGCDTPGKITDVIFSKARQSAEDVCPSQHSFYRVRKILMRTFHVPREAIKADSRLELLIEIEGRKANWDKLVSLLTDGQGIYVSLERPVWLEYMIYLVAPFAGFTVAFFVLGLPFVLAMVASMVLMFILLGATIPFEIHFPSGFATVKDLARLVGSLESKVQDRGDIYHRVRQIVSEQLGVDEDKIFPDSHLVNDLGMDT